MTEFSASRNELFALFIDYRTRCNQWNNGYESNLLYFDRYCSNTYPDVEGISQEMIDGWCTQRESENKNSLIGRTLPARKLIGYLNKRGLLSLIIPDMPSLTPKQYIPHSFTSDELGNFFYGCDQNIMSAKDFLTRSRRLLMKLLS